MSTTTKIEWTDATWGPVTGCTEVSPGCDNCYAKTLAERFRGTPGHYFERGFDVVLRPDKLAEPLKWRKPRRVFVNSMSDLFHKDVPDEYIARVWAVMAATPQHTYQILTKRHGRMRSLLRGDVQNLLEHLHCEIEARALYDAPWPLPNVWLGVSVEDQARADLRIPALLETPAARRFLSCEPLLGPVKLRDEWLGSRWCGQCGEWGLVEDSCGPQHDAMLEDPGDGIHWVIAGGESGRGARPMHPDWARQLRDTCYGSGIPFFFKQWGKWAPAHDRDPRYTGRVKGGWVKADGTGWASFTVPLPGAPQWVLGVGKKHAGRELDGRTHDEFPAVANG